MFFGNQLAPKHSTRRHKYKNKNDKTNKEYKRKRKDSKPKVTIKRKIQRPDEISFNDEERVEFVTDSARRKQERRIKAAKILVAIQHQQHIDLRKERREEEMECLVKGGHIEDPLNAFLKTDFDSSSSSDHDEKAINEYENDDMVSTVITSIPSTVDRNIQFLNDAQNMILEHSQNNVNNDNEAKIEWMYVDACNESNIY